MIFYKINPKIRNIFGTNFEYTIINELKNVVNNS